MALLRAHGRACVAMGRSGLFCSERDTEHGRIEVPRRLDDAEWEPRTGRFGRLHALGGPDRNISGGVLETWAVGKTSSTDTRDFYTGTANPIVGYADSTAYNQPLGLYGDAIRCWDGAISWHTVEGGGGLNDDRVRLLGSEHQTGSMKLFVGTAQQGRREPTSDSTRPTRAGTRSEQTSHFRISRSSSTARSSS